MTENLKFALGRVENIVGKGENAGYQHFSLFPLCFQKTSFTRSLKVGIVWYTVRSVSHTTNNTKRKLLEFLVEGSETLRGKME